MSLSAEQLSFAYQQEEILSKLDLAIPPGRITALVGANGSGKSTILKNLARLLKPTGGGVYLDGKSIQLTPTRLLARELAILPQNPTAPDGLRVRELVSYGRFPWQSALRPLGAEDQRRIDEVLEQTGLTTMARRPVGTLSGGQRQRAWLAMALAQDASTLLLDEPTTFLDMAHQFEILELLVRLNREQGRTIVMVVHDLNHASRYADHMIAVKDGAVVCSGPPAQVMTAAVIGRTFGVKARLIQDPDTGTIMCLPDGLVR